MNPPSCWKPDFERKSVGGDFLRGHPGCSIDNSSLQHKSGEESCRFLSIYPVVECDETSKQQGFLAKR